MQILQKCSFASVSLLIHSCLFYLLYLPPTNAQVIPDNTLPNNSIAPNNCTDCEITGGTQAGHNLFHSFERFSVPTGGRAFFNNSANVQNIFTRVTGQSPSNINGILQANGTANLFLLNPNGIIFGRNASLNIGGSFFASTGDRINFADGTQFSTVSPQASSLLTISAPIGLQVGQNAGAITNRSQASLNGAINSVRLPDSVRLPVGLQVLPGEAIAFISNGIVFDNGNLTARSGRVELASISTGQANLSPLGNSYTLTEANTVSFADIDILNQSSVDTSGELERIGNGGAIQLSGRNIRLDSGSSMISNTYQGSGGNLQFVASDSLTVRTAAIAAQNNGEGQSGNIVIQANNSVNLIGISRAFLTSQTAQNSSGNAGDIHIRTTRLLVRDGFRIEASTLGSGDGGNIRIHADDLEVRGSNREAFSVRGREFLVGQVPSGISSQVGIRSGDNSGDAGNLSIFTHRLIIRDGGVLSTATFSSGNSGILNINATESIDIRGATPAVTRNQYRSGIFVSSEPGEDSTGQSIPATGSVGRLQITTDRLTLDDRAEISANNRGTGNSGTARLDVHGQLILQNGGEIRAGSPRQPFGTLPNQGNGGRLVVHANSIQVMGTGTIGDENFPSAIAAYSESAGNAGNLEITTSSLDVLSGAEVSVSGRDTGAAGNLFVSADRINLDRGRLAASTQAIRGGNIFLGDLELLTLRNNSTLSARATNQARGGNITVRAPNGFVLATGENNDIIADAFQGQGGNITIQARSILGFSEQRSTFTNLTNDIDASSKFGAPGSVTINQIDPDPSRGTVELPIDVVDASRLVSQNCSARGAIARTPSEFVITGRGGLSPSPLEPLNASSPQPHWITSNTTAPPNLEPQDKDNARSPHSNPEIVEAQGWVRNAQGSIVLTADSPVTTQTTTAGLSCSNLH